MRFYLVLAFSLLVINSAAQKQEDILERALFNLPDLSFKKISQDGDSILRYELLIRQPIDHQHPENGVFYQRAILVHRGFDRPTVLVNDGYWLMDYPHEMEQILGANRITMEYRYFGKSKPDTARWEFLTMEQASGDMHAIRELFGKLYTNKWISTGASKGGSTTVYYKFFYPNDVDLSLAYVAPLDNSREDLRIYHFFDTIGTDACRKRISQFQVFLLQHEKEALEKLTWFSKGADLHFNYLGGIGKAFELAVLEYPFSFWQYNGVCDSIPTNKSLEDYLASLEKNVGMFAFSDAGIKTFEPHYYQAATQGGYYSYNIAAYRKYLKHFTSNPSAIFPPPTTFPLSYDSTLNQRVAAWLQEKGNNMIYIYGGLDTWTSAGIIVSDKVNAKRFVIANATHGTANLKHMDAMMQKDFAGKVQEFTGLIVNLAALE